MPSVQSLRHSLEQQKGRRAQILQNLEQTERAVKEKGRDLRRHEEAREIIREVGLKTQQSLQYHISEITTLALEAVFDDPYQIDSNLRGNLGVELEAALDEGSFELAVLAPAFPANGRTTSRGEQRVAGVPLSELDLYEGGVRVRVSSRVKANLGRLEVLAEEVFLKDIRRGREHLKGLLVKLKDEGIRVVICDAEEEEDLAVIVEAVKSSPVRALLCGSAGLAGPLAEGLRSEGSRPDPPFPLRPPRLILSGSLHPLNLRQLSRLEASGRALLFRLPLEYIEEEILESAAEELSRGKDLGVFSPPPVNSARDAVDVASLLGRLGAALQGMVELGGVILSGGDTARAFLRESGSPGLSVGKALLPGVALCRLLGKELPCITKPGGFGPEDAYLRLLEGGERNGQAAGKG